MRGTLRALFAFLALGLSVGLCAAVSTGTSGVTTGVSGGGYSGGAVTSPILVPDGLESAPSYAFANDTDTGWFIAGGTMRGVNAGDQMLILDDGNGRVTVTGNHNMLVVGSTGFQTDTGTYSGDSGGGTLLNLNTDGDVGCTDNAGTGGCAYCLTPDCDERVEADGNFVYLYQNGNIRMRAGASVVSLIDSNQAFITGKKTADPCGGAVAEASIFYNDTSDYMCFCNGSGDDKQVHSPATDCF